MAYDFTPYDGSSEENVQKRINSARKKANYQLPPSPYTVVSEKAKQFQTTDRLKSMSAPKVRTEFHIRKEFSNKIYDPTNSGVYNAAVLKADPTERVKELSKHKGEYKNYVFAKPAIWGVSESAKRFETTDRLHNMSIAFPHKQSQKFVKIF